MPIAIMLIGIAITTNVIGQTTNYVPKWNGSAYVNTVTPIYEDGTNSRIGIGTTSPGYKLDVNGDINIYTSTGAYRLYNGTSSDRILWHNGTTSDILVGVGAGNAAMTGHNNTYVGHVAGNQTTTGYKNVAVGDSAGYGITTGWYCTYMGYNAGRKNLKGDSNTGIGYQALYNDTAYDCTAVGYNAAFSNTSGCSITAVGGNALYYNTTGSDNCAFGYNALNNNTSLSKNVGIGAYALATQSHNGGISSFNVAVGHGALAYNQPTDTNSGKHNSAFGGESGYFNVTGNDNAVFGYQAGYGASTYSYSNNSYFGSQAGFSTPSNANYNVCIGTGAGYSNDESYETFVGYRAGYANSGRRNAFVGYVAGTANTTGDDCTFMGWSSGDANTTAVSNSGFGSEALGATTTGGSNTAIGYQSGGANTSGNSNVFVGYQSGIVITTGTKNTFVGYGTNASGLGSLAFTNCAAIGYNTVVTASNKMFFGDANVVGCYNASNVWGVYSDGRFKVNVKENVSGLDFINKLRPVTYNMDTKKLNDFLHPNTSNKQQDPNSPGNIEPNIESNKDDYTASSSIIRSGFIAQEVEQASKDCGYASTIVTAPSNSNDPYALNYSEFVVPLVKAVQQLDAKIKEQDAIIKGLQATNGGIDISSRSGSTHALNVELNNGNSIILNQNDPNPFAEQTNITYNIPDDVKDAKIIFFDNSGRIIKTLGISERGAGELNVFAGNLSSGIYSYSLLADGKVVDTKKMVKD